MTPFPLLLTELLGKYGAYFIFLLIGFGFGYVLESAGFGHSPKLAAQFYFKEMTVLKVMFTGSIVAMVLVFAATSFGLLDYNLIWVNPTYLWPGILGGLLMGVGFILGGFCPGTSLVSMSTGKIDGVFFVLGVFSGIFVFGETINFYDIFWTSSYMGRFTLPELFGVETGWVVLGVVLMALFMFWGSEKLEQKFGDKSPDAEPKSRLFGAGALIMAAVGLVIFGQPSTLDKWNRMAPEADQNLVERVYQIHPGELLDTMHDYKLNLMMLDVRSESDYNIFHLLDAVHIPLEEISDHIDEFHMEPANTVFVVISNDEIASTEAWKILTAEAVPNVYILDGGINQWLDTFGTPYEKEFCAGLKDEYSLDELKYDFTAALGSECPAAYPDHEEFHLDYTPKMKLELKRAPSSGGCG